MDPSSAKPTWQVSAELLVNVAITDLAASIVTTHVPVPEHPLPLHPVKVEPAAAVATRLIWVPLS
jgi:hypothetical protein